MSNSNKIKTRCRACDSEFEVTLYPNINVSDNPEFKGLVATGELFTSECPHCGHRQVLKYDLLYHDPQEKLLICLTEGTFHSDGMEGYTCRLVSDTGSLMEKVKIFDAGLDDLVIELCKYITLQELNKNVNLKFLRVEGPDQAIIMTYPQNGQMEMMEIGFNVYEDCAAIINRNPALREAAQGLIRLDQEWITRFLA